VAEDMLREGPDIPADTRTAKGCNESDRVFRVTKSLPHFLLARCSARCPWSFVADGTECAWLFRTGRTAGRPIQDVDGFRQNVQKFSTPLLSRHISTD
jgi:hypothetical protein